MLNILIKKFLFSIPLIICGCGESFDYSGLIFYDTRSTTAFIPGNMVNHTLHIGRDELGKIYFITIYDEFSPDYASKINLKLDRDASIRKGFIKLSVKTTLDELIIYPTTTRSPKSIDLIREVNGKIVIDRLDPVVAEDLIVKYSK